MDETRGGWAVLSELLLAASAGGLGVFAGAMLTEGFVLVPWWRSLPPATFLDWYAANHTRLHRFFGSLTAAAAGLALAAAGAALAAGHPGRGPALVAALLALGAVAMFPLCFQAANARFAAGSPTAQELPGELARWARWHALRMALCGAALAAALLALYAPPRG
jgi:hypothetical protein